MRSPMSEDEFEYYLLGWLAVCVIACAVGWLFY